MILKLLRGISHGLTAAQLIRTDLNSTTATALH